MTAARIDSIAVRTHDDPDPDLSWLDCPENYSDLPAAERDKYLEQDRARLANHGVTWWSIGIDARAVIVVNGVRQTITSGGLWGVESDAGDDYLTEVANEQLDELAAILAGLGFSAEDIAAAMPDRMTAVSNVPQ